MRADAAERRTRIVAAARQAFALHGEEVALDVVAQSAGVGIATLYRNFATREQLTEEVARSILLDIQGAAQDAEPLLDVEGSVAWHKFVRTMVHLDISALASALARYQAGDLPEDLRELQQEVLADIDRLLTKASGLGLVRANVSALELVLLVGLISEPKSNTVRELVPNFLENVIALVLAGLASPRA